MTPDGSPHLTQGIESMSENLPLAGVEGLAPLNKNKDLQKGEVKNTVEENQSVVSGVTSPAPTCGTCRWWEQLGQRRGGGKVGYCNFGKRTIAGWPIALNTESCPEHSPKGRAAE